MFGSNVFSKSLLGLLVLVLLSACSEVKFADATSKVDTSGIDDGTGTDPDPRDPGTDPNAPGGTDPRDPGADPSGAKNIYTQSVDIAKNQVDFLLIIDDSSSMLEDQLKLAAKLSGFAEKLSALSVDWQMCVTVTRDQYIGTKTGAAKSADAAKWVWGYPVDWSGNSGTSYILKKSSNFTTAKIDSIVKDTINKIGAGAEESGDERGIRAAYYSFSGDANDPLKKSKNCYRAGSAVSVILISDEDERSVAGQVSRVKQSEIDYVNGLNPPKPITFIAKALEASDYPANLLTQAKSVFGGTARFSYNSIIVKPGDTACEAEQDAQATASHSGTFYAEMSRLTNGGSTSICEADYSKNLELFASLLINYQKDFALRCAPIAASFKVKITSAAGLDITNTVSYTFSGANILFNKDLVQGTKLDFEYYCQK
jgi:hypothetical protein